MSRLGRVTIALLAVACGLGGSAAAHSRRCPRGYLSEPAPLGCLRASVLDRGVRRSPRSALARIEPALVAPLATAAVPSRAQRARHALLHRAAILDRRLLNLVLRGLSATQAAVASQDRARAAPAGASGSSRKLPPPPGQVGGGEQDGGSVTGRDGGIDETGGLGLGWGEYADACPNRYGQVAGTAFWRGTQNLGMDLGYGLAFASTVNFDAQGSFHAEVGQDGRLIDYDLHFVGVVSADYTDLALVAGGRRVVHERVEVSLDFAHLRVGEDLPDYRSSHPVIRVSGYTVPQLLLGEEVGTMNQAASLAETIKNEADSVLETAEQNWYGAAACLKAEFNPSYLNNVDAGSTQPVSITVHPQRDASAPVIMPIALQVSDGSVEPSSAQTAATPLDVKWTLGEKGGTLTVTGVSDRGRLEGSMNGNVGIHIALLYTHTSTADYTYTYDNSHKPVIDYGTFTEHRHAVLQAMIPLVSDGAADPVAHTYTGSAPLQWTSTDWTTTNVATANGQLPTPCTETDTTTLTTASAGTATVTAMPFSIIAGAKTLSLDITIAGVAETWHHHIVGDGVCPNLDFDAPDTALIDNFHQSLGEPEFGSGTPVALHLDGWTDGSGDVLATRTATRTYTVAPGGNPTSAPGTATDTDSFQVVRVSGPTGRG